VYIISFEDPVLRKLNPYVKIGMTYDFKKRVSGIQTGSPLQLKFFGIIECNDPRVVEKFLHTLLKKDRLVGEWFKVSQGLIDAIKTRYKVRDNNLDDLRSSVEDTPETIRIRELERTVKTLRKELQSLKQYTKILKSDHDNLKIGADLWTKERSAKEGRHQLEVQAKSDAIRNKLNPDED
jgi:hypothetical protein